MMRAAAAQGGEAKNASLPRPRAGEEAVASTDVDPREPGHQGAFEVVWLSIPNLVIDEHPRGGYVDHEHVRRLAHAIDEVPPILVHEGTMRVIDGVHRLHAALELGWQQIRAVLYTGTTAQAFILAVQSNSVHGLPLTLAQRRDCAVRLLRENPHLSDRALARVTGVSAKSIGQLRSTVESAQLNGLRQGLDGRWRAPDFAERRQRAVEFLTENPEASLRQVAKATGVALGTAHTIKHELAESRTEPQPPAPPRPSPPIPAPTSPGVGTGSSEEPVLRDRQSIEAAIRTTLSDPHFRECDEGRALLRCLHALAIPSAMPPPTVIAVVPDRRASDVARVIRHFVRAWAEIADELDR